MLLITIGLSILAIGIASVLSRLSHLNETSLREPHNAQLMIGVQIVCGDCSGDARSPMKTYLDRTGNCAQCGGRSFILASNLVVYEHLLMMSRLSVQEATARVQHTEAPTNLYGVRARGLTA